MVNVVSCELASVILKMPSGVTQACNPGYLQGRDLRLTLEASLGRNFTKPHLNQWENLECFENKKI
jgi:hypothetical protein